MYIPLVLRAKIADIVVEHTRWPCDALIAYTGPIVCMLCKLYIEHSMLHRECTAVDVHAGTLQLDALILLLNQLTLGLHFYIRIYPTHLYVMKITIVHTVATYVHRIH